MSNDTNEIMKEYKQKIMCVNNVLATKETIPDTTHPSLPLPALQEVILKMTYLFRVGFLEDMVMALQFHSCKQQIEKAVLELQRKQYVISGVTSEFGKCIVLTKEALFFFRYHPDYTCPRKKRKEVLVKDDTIPCEDNIIKYKCISAYACNAIFNEQLMKSVLQFKSQSKETKQHYAREEYSRNIIYKEFLSQSEQEKRAVLSSLALDKDTIDKYSRINLYSKTFAIVFSNAYLKSDINKDSLESSTGYQSFRTKINHLFKQNHSQQELFHFLKDYINQWNKPDLHEIIQTLLSQCHNLYRGNDIRMRNQLLKTGTPKVRNESKLYMLKEHRRLLTNRRKSLIRAGAVKDLLDTELQEYASNLNEIDNAIINLETEIQLLSKAFTFLLYKGEKENGAIEFFEKQLELNTLKKCNVYVSIQGSEISFCILASNRQPLSHIELFQRLERAFKIYLNLFPLYLPNFLVITYGKERQHQMEMALIKTKKTFNDIQDYRMLALLLETNLSVINVEHHPTERFEFYQRFVES